MELSTGRGNNKEVLEQALADPNAIVLFNDSPGAHFVAVQKTKK